MERKRNEHRKTFGKVGTWLLLAILFLVGGSAAAAASEYRPNLPAPEARRAALFGQGWSWRKLYDPVESGLSSRRSIVQMGAIGMCIGIYLLMRR